MIFILSIVGMMLRAKGPFGVFLKAGAISPLTARRPDKIGMKLADRPHIPGAVRRGLLVDMGDGRYWLDAKKLKRRRAMLAACVALIALTAIAGVAWWLTR